MQPDNETLLVAVSNLAVKDKLDFSSAVCKLHMCQTVIGQMQTVS